MKYSVLLILVLGITVGGCQKDKEQAPTQEPAVARGTLSVTEQDLQQGLDLLSEQDRKFAETSFGRQNLLQILTREKLILQDARDTGLEQGKEYKQALAQKRAELDAIYDQFAQEALVRAWYED
ncbi:MAG: hypothetical protein IKW71_03075, partial [Elusimicrobiaceae bacterium]|nr:hypothetical protein [Elusimicrobiaceae bacterium]